MIMTNIVTVFTGCTDDRNRPGVPVSLDLLPHSSLLSLMLLI